MYALHETLEVQEIAAFKCICLTKSKTMQALISDAELKSILQRDVEATTRHLQELSAVLNQAVSQGSHP